MGPTEQGKPVPNKPGLMDYLGERVDAFKQGRDEVLGTSPKIPVQDRPASYPPGEVNAPKPAAPIVPAAPAVTPPAITPPVTTSPSGDSLAGATWNVANPDRPLPADVKARGDSLADYMGAKDQGWNAYLASPEGGMAKDGSVMTQQEAGPVTGATTRNYRAMGAMGEGAGVAPMSRGTGGFAGSATDAEAARHLQSRFEQDAAASQMVASLNKGAEAERDLRATQLGIGRGTLDRMEGRNDTPAAMAAAAQQGSSSSSSPGSLWDRSGDGFGDAARRQAKYDSLVEGAANEKGFGARRRAERKLMAAQAMLAPYQQQMENQQKDAASRHSLAGQLASSQASLAGQRYNADAELRGKQMDQETSRYGSRLTAQQQADKNRLEAEKSRAELWIRAAEVEKQSGADLLNQDRVAMARRLATETDPAKRRALMEAAGSLGGRFDDMTMAAALAKKPEKP